MREGPAATAVEYPHLSLALEQRRVAAYPEI